MPPTGAEGAAFVDAVASAVNIVGAVTRVLPKWQVASPELLWLTCMFVAAAALPLIARFAAPKWHVRRRCAVAAITRLGCSVALAAPFAIPDRAAGLGSFAWLWLFNSQSVVASALNIGFSLPLRMHLPVTAVQLACMASMALQRCEVLGPPPPASPSVSFLSFSPLPGRLFSILAALLDWPMRIVARTADLSFPNERAACLACTLWVQAVVGALLPTTLLLAAARASAAPAPPAAELPASGTGGQQGRREGWLALLEREFQEHPAQMAAFTAQLLWLVLRTATAVLLE